MSIAVSAFMLVLAGSAASAQTPATSTPAPVVTTASVSPAPTPATTAETQTTAAPGPYWALIGGYEWDTHGSSYGFFGPAYTRPFKPNVAWTARVFGNYLTYEFTDVGGETRVTSPGVVGALGLQFGEKHTFAVSAGPSVSWRKTKVTSSTGAETESDDTRVGANFGGELSLNPTPANNIQAILNYNTTDKYTWGRVGAKTQVTNRSWTGSNALFLGVEGIAQGNDDIRSLQGGGLFEINHVPSKFSVMFRAGYKRSTFDVGPSKTGPYFGIGIYKRLN
jgi:hypothetical protein